MHLSLLPLLRSLRLYCCTALLCCCFSLSAPGQVLSWIPPNVFLHPVVLHRALLAYQCACDQGMDTQAILTIIDYSLPSTMKRLWVLDMKHHRILFHAFVAHGSGSGLNVAKNFSNAFNSKKSSIGLFRTGETYQGYHGYSLRLYGLEKGINDHAFERSIVIHSAWYVSDSFAQQHGHLGRSWGCPALNKQVSKPLIQAIRRGTLLFIDYPDAHWLQTSRFLHCNRKTTIQKYGCDHSANQASACRKA